MTRQRKKYFCILFLICIIAWGCAKKGPNPWKPKTYVDELDRFTKDPQSLPKTWARSYVKGQKESSFFYYNDGLQASIIVTFTCGKYMDIPLEQLAEHPRFSMGASAKVLQENYVQGGDVDIYHVVVRGLVAYEESGGLLGGGDKNAPPKPAPKTEMMMDYYVVGEPNCVVDVIYLVPPRNYEKGLSDFHACLRDMGIPGDIQGSGVSSQGSGG